MSASDRGFRAALKAGVLYFAGVFALGFLFGGVRLMLLEPNLGELLAVIIEIPVMLVFCWVLCTRAIAVTEVAAQPATRVVMGATAFFLLMVAEFILASVLFGEAPPAYVQGYSQPDRLLGLLGQLLFAAFPLIQLYSGPRSIQDE